MASRKTGELTLGQDLMDKTFPLRITSGPPQRDFELSQYYRVFVGDDPAAHVGMVQSYELDDVKLEELVRRHCIEFGVVNTRDGSNGGIIATIEGAIGLEISDLSRWFFIAQVNERRAGDNPWRKIPRGVFIKGVYSTRTRKGGCWITEVFDLGMNS